MDRADVVASRGAAVVQPERRDQGAPAQRGPLTPPRILVLFGGVPLWGQEIGNIEVIDTLVKETAAACLFVTNRDWGYQAVQPELDRRGLPWTSAPYAARFEKAMPLRRWIRNAGTILAASLALIRIMRCFRPTHIHVCSPVYFVNFLPVLLLTRTPVIYRLGDQVALHHPAWRFLWRRLIAPRVAEFVCISRFLEADLKAQLGRPVVTSVIYPRPAARPGVAASPLPRVDLPGFKFVYLGQIAEGKGVHLLVQAAIDLASHRAFVLYVGGDDCPLANDLRERIRQLRLDDRIFFLGRVADVDRLLRASDVHVCPSLWQEGLGQVVLEAKRAGRPSIVFPSGGLTELVSNGIDGYVCPAKTADALRDALLSYLDHPDQARRQGAAARRSLERLGVDRFGACWQEVYRRTARA